MLCCFFHSYLNEMKKDQQSILELIWKKKFLLNDEDGLDCSVQTWETDFLKLSGEREKFELYWHPKSHLIQKFHDISMIFQIPWFFHACIFFSDFPIFSRACENPVKGCFVCLICEFTSWSTTMVILRGSVNLTTLFLRIRIRIVYWWNAEMTITHQDLWISP